jgi:hypothetical protein
MKPAAAVTAQILVILSDCAESVDIFDISSHVTLRDLLRSSVRTLPWFTLFSLILAVRNWINAPCASSSAHV